MTGQNQTTIINATASNLEKEALYVVKIGGNIIDDNNKLDLFLKDFAAIKGKKILVHGGGKLATQLAKDLGLKISSNYGIR